MMLGVVTIYTSVQGSKKRWDIQVVTPDGIIGPGEVASPAHSVSGSILQALAVTSSRECLCVGVVAASKGRSTLDVRRNQSRTSPSPATQA